MRYRLRFATLAFMLMRAASFAADHPIGGDRLLLKDPPDAARRAVRFTASRDVAIDASTAADPRSVGATLEILGTDAGDGATGPIALDPSFWTGLGRPPGSKGYRYLDFAASTGIKKVMFKVGGRGGSLIVSGKGNRWPYRVTQPQGPITVRFTVGSDVYCAELATFDRNELGTVTARNAPPPGSCTVATCGNGVVEGGEECDDTNTTSDDGCSATCELETAAAVCAGVPTVAGTSLSTVRIASGLSNPLHLTAAPLDPSRVFVVEQPGRIRIIKNGILQPTPFLAIEDEVSCCGERGLLSVAFHPDYETNGRFFVYYTEPDGDIAIARYEVSGNPDLADEASGHILFTIDHHAASNHNGGQLAFGPDGYLYAATGDGGGGGDPFESGQDLSSLLGKQLRIDVDVDTPPYYAMPAGNPFSTAGDPLNLVWAYGLRNPWRFSFDRLTGELYTGDVGQGQWEEVDVQPAATGGLDYGWDVYEGRHCFMEPDPDDPCPASPAGFTMPVLEYSHALGCSITGGFVYRGCRMPDVRGTYFYSDYCSAFIRTFQGVVAGDAQSTADRTAELVPPVGTIDTVTSFGEDARGELYIVDHGGEVFRIVPGP